jgi:hypothetical protein
VPLWKTVGFPLNLQRMYKTLAGLKLLVNYGAVSALLSFGVFLLIWQQGYFPLGQSAFLFGWFPFIFMILGTKKLRDQLSNGVINYWDSFKSCCIVAAASALLLVLLIYIFGSVIDPNFLANYKSENLKAMEISSEAMKSMFGESNYDKMEDELVANLDKTTLGTIVTNEYLNKLLFGVIFSFIAAAFLRKQSSTETF